MNAMNVARRTSLSATVGFCVLAAVMPTPVATQTPAGQWRTAWATSQQGVASGLVSNTTLRLIARVTVGGDAIRIRLDNSYGKTPLQITKASVALRARGAALVAGSSQPALFSGRESVTIPAGGTMRSDPISLTVPPFQDVAVSLYLPEIAVAPSQHAGALTTSYAAAAHAGDRTSVELAEPFSATITSMPWLKAIDVRSSSSPGTIVAFGDSITDGTCATVDAHDRWVDWLAIRLALQHPKGAVAVHKAVVNEGIGGNTVTRDGLQPPPDSTPGLERLERDVLTHEGVSDVILFMGTNDIRRGASAAQVKGGLQQLAERLKRGRLKVFAATIVPRHNVAASGTNTGWDAAKTAIRREVNDWIRSGGQFDGVLDFDAAVRDPSNPDLLFGPFNCDGIHPTPRGYFEMGRLLPLELFTR
jgi:lysophospholipase L1-like esterase